MTTIHLGVIDIPYAEAPKKNRRKSGKTPNQTTGDVAEILEAKYGIMEKFVELHGDDVIVPALEEAIQGAMDELLGAFSASGTTVQRGGVAVEANAGVLNPNIFGTAEGKIDEAFRKMLDEQELDSAGVAGVPTEAAQRGVNHRLKHPYKKRVPRPSFIDTGLYSTSFKSWVD